MSEIEYKRHIFHEENLDGTVIYWVTIDGSQEAFATLEDAMAAVDNYGIPHD